MTIGKNRKRQRGAGTRYERLYRQYVDSQDSLLALIVDVIVDSLGRQALDALERQLSEKFVEKVRDLPLRNRDAMAAADLIDEAERLALIKGEFTERSPERVVKRITRCPVAELKLSANYCEFMGATGQATCKGVDNRLNIALARCMTKGDPYCEWIVERESQTTPDATPIRTENPART